MRIQFVPHENVNLTPADLLATPNLVSIALAPSGVTEISTRRGHDALSVRALPGPSGSLVLRMEVDACVLQRGRRANPYVLALQTLRCARGTVNMTLTPGPARFSPVTTVYVGDFSFEGCRDGLLDVVLQLQNGVLILLQQERSR